MKKNYYRSREGYGPGISQWIIQAIRCRINKHIWVVNDVVENHIICGEIRVCEHCGTTIENKTETIQ